MSSNPYTTLFPRFLRHQELRDPTRTFAQLIDHIHLQAEDTVQVDSMHCSTAWYYQYFVLRQFKVDTTSSFNRDSAAFAEARCE